MTKRRAGQWHHMVPQFYLRRFADAGRKLAVVHRGDGSIQQRSVRQAAAETDFYAFETLEGDRSYEVENALSQVESAAAPAIARVLRTL